MAGARLNSWRARPSPPGIFTLDDGIGLIIKQIDHIPSTSPAVLAISSRNASYRSYERPLSEFIIFGQVAGAIGRL